MPGGRPKKTTENCLPENWKQIILDLSKEGCSEVEIRATLCLAGGSFSDQTWYTLQEREEEFSETIQKAKVLCQAWWEKQGRVHIKHGKEYVFETGLWYANMKNRFGWKDNHEARFKVEDAQEYFKTITDAIIKSDTNSD